ncbi:MAG: heme exporter protein CcmD [Sphingomonas sp.]
MRLDPWPFVIAAYAVTVLAIAVLSLLSWRAMRRAEAAVEANRRA